MMMGEITSFYIEGEIRVTTILIKNWKKKKKEMKIISPGLFLGSYQSIKLS